MKKNIAQPNLAGAEIRVEYQPLTSVLGALRNPKGHDVGLLHQSIDRFSFVEPLVLNETTGRLVAGHGRLEVLRQKKASGEKPPGRIVERDGEWFVPVIRGVGFATDAEAEAYLIASNQTVLAGGWDEAGLVPILSDLAISPGGLDGIGFDGDDVDRLMRDLQRASGESLTTQDAEPSKSDELQKKWRTQLGQMWDIAGHRIWCGDSREVPASLFNGNKVRLVWTDPPYGVDYGAKNEFLQAYGKSNRSERIKDDALKPEEVRKLFASSLAKVVPYCEKGAALYATVPASLLPTFVSGMEEGGFAYHHALVWVKSQFVIGRSDYHYRHEPILYGWIENGPHYFAPDRTQDSVFEIDKPHVSAEHPTMKPLELVAKMIANSSQPTDIIYDPFCGSGTTIIAAHQLDRIGYGCEIDAAYTAVVLERLSLLGLKPELIESDLASASAPTPKNEKAL